ncbi:MAG: BLUF domain-containing protein [Paracoccus sp. (in: a-proteobacteria)]|nr:BLUF domain-containing protein [Paracoccus sp. (in: a-proteobacteria)]
MALSYVIYRSLGRLESFGSDCEAILTRARDRNSSYGLTGFLHAEDGIFVQWLEGASEHLDLVLALILGDPRHRDITIFNHGPIAARQFPQWAMGFSSGKDAPLFDYLAEQDINSHDHRAYADGLQRFLLQRAA